MSDHADVLELATELTVAWLRHPNTRTSMDRVPVFLRSMNDALAELVSKPSDLPEEPIHTPAVSARKSLASKDHIISMIDGRPYKSLRRHLRLNGLTPDEYRDRYGLRRDYPMVAEAFSENRRLMAKKIGLGGKRKMHTSDG